MTEQELAEIQALASAATEDPWTVLPQTPKSVAGPGVMIAITSAPEDAEFIANARESVPELIAEVRRLRGLERVAELTYRMAKRRCWDEGAENSDELAIFEALMAADWVSK